MHKVDNVWEKISNVSREMEIPRKSKWNARDQNTVTETKSTFDELISRLDNRAEERISELENMSIETSKLKKRERERQKINTDILSFFFFSSLFFSFSFFGISFFCFSFYLFLSLFSFFTLLVLLISIVD